jgi:hypothetical protein
VARGAIECDLSHGRYVLYGQAEFWTTTGLAPAKHQRARCATFLRPGWDRAGDWMNRTR